jgi:Zn ribbon nucleic-acid-binding protein
MAHVPTRPVECVRCPICQTATRIEIPADSNLQAFECLKCGQVTVATDRVKGPIVWLAGWELPI